MLVRTYVKALMVEWFECLIILQWYTVTTTYCTMEMCRPFSFKLPFQLRTSCTVCFFLLVSDGPPNCYSTLLLKRWSAQLLLYCTPEEIVHPSVTLLYSWRDGLPNCYSTLLLKRWSAQLLLYTAEEMALEQLYSRTDGPPNCYSTLLLKRKSVLLLLYCTPEEMVRPTVTLLYSWRESQPNCYSTLSRKRWSAELLLYSTPEEIVCPTVTLLRKR